MNRKKYINSIFDILSGGFIYSIMFLHCITLLKIKLNCLIYANSLEIKKILVNYNEGNIELDACNDQLSVRDDGSVYLYYKLDDSMKSLLLNNVDKIIIGNYIIWK